MLIQSTMPEDKKEWLKEPNLDGMVHTQFTQGNLQRSNKDTETTLKPTWKTTEKTSELNNFWTDKNFWAIINTA